MKKLIVSAMALVVSCAVAMATRLGDVIEMAKGVNAAQVVEMNPAMAPGGAPIESGYIVMLPPGTEAPVLEKLAAVSGLEVIEEPNQKCYFDTTVDPCEVLILTSANGTNVILFVQGTADMVDILKSADK